MLLGTHTLDFDLGVARQSPHRLARAVGGLLQQLGSLVRYVDAPLAELLHHLYPLLPARSQLVERRHDRRF